MAIVNVNDRITITTTNDYIEVGTADKIDVIGGKDITVGANDKLAVVPFQSATSIDYKIPQTVIDGLATVESLRGDLLNRLLALDVGLISAQQYIDNIYNNIREQVYTDLDVKYVSNTDIADIVNNAIVNTDLSNLSIVTEYDINGYPTVTTNLSEIKDRYIEVGDALSSFTSQLNANTTISSSALSQTNTLTARVEDTEAIISSNEYVAVGGFTEYITGTPITGQWRYTISGYQQYRGNEWISITNEQFNRYNVSSTIAGAKSLSTVGDAIVGWEYTNGGTGDNQFKIKADKFYLEAAGSSTTSSAYVPFAVDAATGSIVFNGNVTFGNNQTGTVNDAVTSIVTDIVSTVALGDKNINITDNLIPTTSFVADTDSSGYQLGGTCYKSMSSGLDVFAEAQCNLVNTASEMYSPYVDEMSVPYYYRFGIQGITSYLKFKVVTINSNNAITYGDVTSILNPGVVLDATEWYQIDGIINPFGGLTGASGSIRNSLGAKVGIINNFIIPEGAVKLLLGWGTGPCIVSRMKLAKVTAETLTSVVATTDFVENSSADALLAATTLANSKMAPSELNTELARTTTVINGSRITTGTIDANIVNVTNINASNIKTNNALVGHILQSSDFSTIGNGGFRLKTNASETFDDPTIYGAYIRGGTVYGSYLRASTMATDSLKVANVNYPNNSGPFTYQRVEYVSNNNCGNSYLYTPELVFYSPSYGTGYLANRILNSTQERTIRGEKGQAYHVSWIIIQRNTDNAGWVTVWTSGQGEGGTSNTLVETTPFTTLVKYRVGLAVDCGNGVNVSANISGEFNNFD